MVRNCTDLGEHLDDMSLLFCIFFALTFTVQLILLTFPCCNDVVKDCPMELAGDCDLLELLLVDMGILMICLNAS
jgi:hypothetical protein